jgi:hypothetical protein
VAGRKTRNVAVLQHGRGAHLKKIRRRARKALSRRRPVTNWAVQFPSHQMESKAYATGMWRAAYVSSAIRTRATSRPRLSENNVNAPAASIQNAVTLRMIILEIPVVPGGRLIPDCFRAASRLGETASFTGELRTCGERPGRRNWAVSPPGLTALGALTNAA